MCCAECVSSEKHIISFLDFCIVDKQGMHTHITTNSNSYADLYYYEDLALAPAPANTCSMPQYALETTRKRRRQNDGTVLHNQVGGRVCLFDSWLYNENTKKLYRLW